MHELLCGPADFTSLKAREDYSTPEPLTRRPRRRLPRPTLQFLVLVLIPLGILGSVAFRVSASPGETISGVLSPVFKQDGAKTARSLSFGTARLSVRVKKESFRR